ncbi:MAG: 4-coumarate--CoA ligase [Alteromonadaceae bacterium]|nr:4-coumarate--CoA ligase [Alteromonadaceae bacterium]
MRTNVQIADAALPLYAPEIVNEQFEPITTQLQRAAQERPDQIALIEGEGGQKLSWQGLMKDVNQLANRLIAAGVAPGDKVAGLAENSIAYVTLYLATLAAGGCMVPLSAMASGETLRLMIDDSDAKLLFVSNRNLALAEPIRDNLSNIPRENQLALDFEAAEWQNMAHWIGQNPDDSAPSVEITPDHPFNIIYSSGTTGTPKGILHDHRMRSRQIKRMGTYGLDGDAINLVSTPLYSNTTLVSALPVLAHGGTLVLMAKFNAHRFLELAEQYKVTHAMLVPVQYQRILAEPDFDTFDLSSFKLKLSTSAPLRSGVIAEAMRRWPGNIREVYGLTEGGISTSLDCAAFPDKWDSVGCATEGAEILTIDDEGNPLPTGEIGEIVGRAGAMMRAYYKREQQTAEILWTSPEGNVFYRSGDMGRIDEDGFLYLLDRRKDMIISGGFNIYAEDLERVLLQHESVSDVAVIGIPSDHWGETPLALVVPKQGAEINPETLRAWANERLDKAQRLAAVEFRNELPRSTIGKILKRELRQPYW